MQGPGAVPAPLPETWHHREDGLCRRPEASPLPPSPDKMREGTRPGRDSLLLFSRVRSIFESNSQFMSLPNRRTGAPCKRYAGARLPGNLISASEERNPYETAPSPALRPGAAVRRATPTSPLRRISSGSGTATSSSIWGASPTPGWTPSSPPLSPRGNACGWWTAWTCWRRRPWRA